MHALYQQNRFLQLKQLCKQIIQVDYYNENANHFLGLIAHRSSAYAVAVQFYQRALKQHANSASVLNNMGNSLWLLNQQKEAIACYQKAIQIAPNHAPFYYNLANNFESIGEVEQAKEQAKETPTQSSIGDEYEYMSPTPAKPQPRPKLANG